MLFPYGMFGEKPDEETLLQKKNSANLAFLNDIVGFRQALRWG